jgi:hypothetical protein
MTTFLIICLGLFALLFAVKIIYVLCTALVVGSTRGALYVSTTKRRIAACLDTISVKKGGTWIDLGCGDGRILKHAGKRYNITGIGYELNLMAYWKAKITSLGMHHIQIHLKNFFKADLSQADIVSCYLFPDVMQDLARKLKAELKPGTTIVSFNFPLPGFVAEQVLRPEGSLHNDPIFVYHMH